MPVEILIWVLLFATLLLGVPVYVSLGIASVITLVYNGFPITMVSIDLFEVSKMYSLLAVPAFVLAGSLMEKGGMANQIVEIASMIVGRIKGGLGIVTILGSMFFAAMIGSGPGTVAAMGGLMIPSMLKAGYSREYAAGVSATGGTLGILMPPSNPLIVYGVIANLSITGLFAAGIVPAFITGLVLMLTAYALAKRAGYKGSTEDFTITYFAKTVYHNKWSLAAPFVILGVIYLGITTPVEASAIAVFYSLFVGIFITKQLKIRQIWESIKDTNITIAMLTVVVGVSVLFGELLTVEQIPQKFTEILLNISTNPYIVLFMIVLLLLILGMFMETLATIVILAPILLPAVTSVGINPYAFGIIWIITNEVAMLTPPLGVNLFVSMNISKLSLERVSKGALPYVFVLILLVIFFIFFPNVILFLPEMFGGI
ncbi:TRAP transporter large permease [Oceanobacillus timonensis]|uniref:TRAP transporter large permease n=1 Tax=Oceanobacillus timonensis TaxID=1926285 RepID=UPI0009BC050F|nr:TRAP transporter large permease [Oceanobacillus timonensis]